MNLRYTFLKFMLNLLSSLPFALLYLLSDFLAFSMRSVVKYRKNVVFQNIRFSFPEKNEKEVNRVVRQFYRNLADLIVELIKSQKLDKNQLIKRVRIKNEQVFEQLFKENKCVILSLGHCGNWEWAGNRINLFLKHKPTAIYKPLSDKFFNDYMIKQRQKYNNTLMIEYKKTFRTLASLKNELPAVFMLADQSPAKTEINYWDTFLGRQTPFYTGLEKIARALDYSVVYLDIQRNRRGYYTVDVQKITENASATADYEITKKYIHLLENSIIKHPDNWLWSHRRWKFLKEERTT